MILDSAIIASRIRRPLSLQCRQNFFEFADGLVDQLAHLGSLFLGILSAKTLPGAADGKSLVIEQRTNLANQQHVLALIITSIAAPLYRVEHGKLLLPITQHVWFDITELAHLANGEVAFSRNRGQLLVITWFQHSFLPWPSVFGPA